MFDNSQFFGGGADPFYPHTIDGALFIDGLSTASLSRAAVAVDDTTKATWSFWWKRASGLYTNFSSEGEFFLQNTNGTNRGFRLRTNSLGEGTLSLYVNPTSGTSAQLVTDREFRDQAGWVHVIWHWDSANAVESERVRLYVNGTRVTEFSTETYPPLNDAHDFNTGFGSWRVGSTSSYQGTSAGKRAFRGYLTEFHFMDGYNYGPEYFGETKSGVWVPIEVTGVTYGTGGWYLPMTSNGNDASGNGNHFTENSVGAHDYKTDSPTNNFCVLDANNSYNFRLSEGNLKFANTTTRWDGALATFAVPKTGKWYWEVYINAGTNVVTGLANGSSNLINDTGYDEYENYSYGINQTSVRYGTTVISTESPPTSTSGDVLGWYVDDGDVYLYKNGTQIASPTSWTSNMSAVDYDYFPQIFAYGSGTGATFNFGQDGTFAGATTAGGNADSQGIGDFKYTVPTGAKALCTSNLPAPALADPSNEQEGRDYFETFTYTGNGGALQVGDVTKKPADTTTISNSLLFVDDNSSFLSRTPSTGGSQTTFTFSCWVKRSQTNSPAYLFSAGASGASTELFYIQLRNDANNHIFTIVWRDGSSTTRQLTANRKFKNLSLWDHFVVAVKTDESTAADRMKVYVNGILETNFSYDDRSTLSGSSSLAVNAASTLHTIGAYSVSATGTYLDAYLAEVHFIDGTAYEALDFGSFDAGGIWIPKAVSGLSYGTNGFHLDFSSTTPATQSLSFTEYWSDLSNWSGSGTGSTSVSNGTVSFAPTSSSSWGGRTLTHTLSADYQDFDITFNDWTVTNVSNDLIRYKIWLYDSDDNIVAGYYFLDAYVSDGSGAESNLYVYNGSNNIEDLLSSLGTAARTYTVGPADFRIARTGRVVTFDMPGFTNISAMSANMNPVDKIVLTVERLSGYSYSPNSLGTISATGSPVITTIEDQVGSNDWALNNMNFADSQTTDSPTDNHAVLNSDSGNTFTDGNLFTTTGTSSNRRSVGTLGMRTGKHYWEVTLGSTVTYGPGIGIHSKAIPVTTNVFVLADGDHSAGYYKTGDKYVNGTASSYGSAMQPYDTVGVAYDADAKTLEFYLNNVSQGSFGVGSEFSDVAYPVVGDGSGSVGVSVSINFGQLGFVYTPPTGYTALSQNNLSVDEHNLESPDFVWIKNRDQADSHQLYDSVRGIQKLIESDPATNPSQADAPNGLIDFNKNGFTVGNDNRVNTLGEDYVAWNWKSSGTAQSATYEVKVVSDSGNKYRFDDFGSSAVTLELSEGGTYTFDQSDSSNSGHPLRFSTTSNGTHGGGSEYTTGVTTNGTPGSAGAYTRITVAAGAPTLYYYCSVHSGMGGQANTPFTKGSSNFKGTRQSKVLANTDSGFSIVDWTYSTTSGTVGHGLSSAPEMILVKGYDSSSSLEWIVWHKAIGTMANRKYLKLNENITTATGTNAIWGDSDPTTTVFGQGQGLAVDGDQCIAYCFHSVDGFSKFGSFEGNEEAGQSDGAFVYTGFAPAFVMIKNFDSAANWIILDNKRPNLSGSAFNPKDTSSGLYPDSSSAESTDATYRGDFFSNGFSVASASTAWNNGNNTFLFMAFGETPFKYGNAR